MIFSIGIILAFIGWALGPRGLELLAQSVWLTRLPGFLLTGGLFLVVLSIAIMTWGVLP